MGKPRQDIDTRIKEAYKKLEKSYGELRDSHIEMIFRMALLAEYRDSNTGTHLVRVADYSALLAKELGLEDKEIEIIRYATPMHDIGKIILPDTILKKRGDLTEEEKTLMRTHPKAGYNIFKNAKTAMTKACGVIAYTHHERFDGTGYPQGLKGEKIPLYGRIVAVADCFDAFTSNRSYKEAYAFDKSVSMIVERAGGHFDPQVVMAFMKCKDEIEKIWKANRDIEAFLMDMGVKNGKLE